MLKKNLLKITATLGVATLGVSATAGVANADVIYTVQPGDTLSSISQKFAGNDRMVNILAQTNNIKNINLIYVGQKLLIKNDGEIRPASQQEVAAVTSQTQTPVQNTTPTSANANASYVSSVSGSNAAAKAWIAARESGNDYGARNGQYIGKYQLSAAYLNGDYSPANQERVADQYVASRYGSWVAAQHFWQANGWY